MTPGLRLRRIPLSSSRRRRFGQAEKSVKAIAAYLLAATAGMTLWAWAVLSVRVHLFHLAALAVAVALCFPLSVLRRNGRRRRS